MGEFLRQSKQRHECGPPARAQTGAVWRCDCGRRWTCVVSITERPGFISMEADWRRRYWPWPRLTAIRGTGHMSDGIPVDADSLPKVPSGPAQGAPPRPRYPLIGPPAEYHCHGCQCPSNGAPVDFNG